jgi:hypothetical protein
MGSGPVSNDGLPTLVPPLSRFAGCTERTSSAPLMSSALRIASLVAPSEDLRSVRRSLPTCSSRIAFINRDLRPECLHSGVGASGVRNHDIYHITRRWHSTRKFPVENGAVGGEGRGGSRFSFRMLTSLWLDYEESDHSPATLHTPNATASDVADGQRHTTDLYSAVGAGV